MFCLNCGKEIPDDAKFCRLCGASVNDGEKTVMDQPVQPPVQPAQPEPEYPSAQYTAAKPAGSGKRNVIILVVVLVLLVIGSVVTLFATGTIGGNDPEKLMESAERYLKDEEYDKAIIEFEKLLEIDDQNIDAYFGLADVYMAQEDYKKAIREYENILAIDDQNVEAYLGIADAYEAQDKTEKAIEILEEALDTLEDDKDIKKIQRRLDKLTADDEGFSPPTDTIDQAEQTAAASTQTSTEYTTTTADIAYITTPADEYIDDVIVDEPVADYFVPDGDSGTIVWLGYYDLATDGGSAEQYKIFNSDTYGGSIEYISCPSGSEYFNRLGELIAADDSPDIVRYEWLSYPMGISKHMYESLDDYIDIDDPLWSDMSDIIENFAYNGEHYYFPYRLTSNFAVNYNRKALLDAGLTDPYELYLENNWTWDTFRELMIEWCNIDDDNIGYCGTGGVSFIATTGTPLIDVRPDGTIYNNIYDANVARAMEFTSDLYRNGLTYQEELGDWVSPVTWAVNCDRILFLGMGPEWTYSAASSAIQNPTGVDNDILNTPSDFAFVPFPRDPSSDEYHIAYDSLGYMVPKGAKNIKGAVDWIQLNRVYYTDENMIAMQREEAINPEPVYYTSGKYDGMQKWQLMWDERVYNVLEDMTDPAKFSFVFDDCYGFNEDMTEIADIILEQPMFEGASWTQLSSEYASQLDVIIDEYR